MEAPAFGNVRAPGNDFLFFISLPWHSICHNKHYRTVITMFVMIIRTKLLPTKTVVLILGKLITNLKTYNINHTYTTGTTN